MNINFKILFLFTILNLFISKNICTLSFIDENIPPDYIRNIQNPIGALVPNIIFPVCTVPYYPLLMIGYNLGNSSSNITVYIGKLACTDPIFFTNETFTNAMLNGSISSIVGYNDVAIDSYEIHMDMEQDITYIKNLLNYSLEHPGVSILKCNLQTINISSIYLKAQDIFIVVDGVLGIANNYFLYKDVSSCSGNTDSCNGYGECFLGICLCIDTKLEGPLCNLKRSLSNENKLPSWTLNTQLPEIIYFNGNSSWSIKFTTLDIAKKSSQDSRGMLYSPFLDFEFQEWEIINTTVADDTLDQSQRYNLVTDDITITIDVTSIGRQRDVDFFPFQNVPLTFGVGDLRVSITLSGLSENLQNTHCFKLVFEIETIDEPIPRCGFLDDEDHFDFDYGRGYDRDDVRWVAITGGNFSSLYARLYGKCISDQLPQSCIFDLNEDPESQNKGDATLFIFFEPFQFNVSVNPDFKILTYIDFPNVTLQTCKEFIPKTNLTNWLIPSIIPVISIGLFCLGLVVFNLVKVNRNSLEFDSNNLNDQTLSNNHHGGNNHYNKPTHHDGLFDDINGIGDYFNIQGDYDNYQNNNNNNSNNSSDVEEDEDNNK